MNSRKKAPPEIEDNSEIFCGHPARRWNGQPAHAFEEEHQPAPSQRDRGLAGKPLDRFTEKQYAELQKEMEDDDHRDAYCLDLWEKLTEQAKQRPLSQVEKRDIFYCELNFGGRAKFIERRARLAAQS